MHTILLSNSTKLIHFNSECVQTGCVPCPIGTLSRQFIMNWGVVYAPTNRAAISPIWQCCSPSSLVLQIIQFFVITFDFNSTLFHRLHTECEGCTQDPDDAIMAPPLDVPNLWHEGHRALGRPSEGKEGREQRGGEPIRQNKQSKYTLLSHLLCFLYRTYNTCIPCHVGFMLLSSDVLRTHSSQHSQE